MRTHTVRAAELDRFVRAGGAASHREEVRQYVQSMFDLGSMRPEWCFVTEGGGRSLGRVALWTLPGMDEPLDLVLLDVSWEDLCAGECLLADVLQRARSFGAPEIGHVLDTPSMWPQWQDSPDRRVELLEGAGFTLRRATSRFEWREEGGPPASSRRLGFRTLEEVGHDAFVDALARVSEGTLDRRILEEREREGPEKAALEFFEDALRLRHDLSWWRLAYAPGSELVGLVMPAEAPTFMTIYYIGVVPEHRGRGHVDDLLATGTATLLAAGTKPLMADVDVLNAPMVAAFERAGWAEFAKRREYGVKLAPVGATTQS